MQKTETAQRDFDVVVVGGGSAGIGVTASLLRRRPGLRIAVIEPSDNHYYQPRGRWSAAARSMSPRPCVRRRR